MSNIFIAPKIKVGFQERDDTYNNSLAYIIYYDQKGKLHKETSWESWRNKKIPPQEFDNTPMESFTLNKAIKRGGYDWYSKSTTKIRIHDPRGFEFEISAQNLITILMHTDCLKRGIIGKCVYAWCNSDLILLPTSSEEYQQATQYTAGLSQSVKSKDLVLGASYKLKRKFRDWENDGEDADSTIYVGRFNWYSYPDNYFKKGLGERQEKKSYVFTNDNGKTFYRKDNLSFLCAANTNEPCSNYAELVDKFNAQAYAHKIVKLDFVPVEFDPTEGTGNYSDSLKKSFYYRQCATQPELYYRYHVGAEYAQTYDYTTNTRGPRVFKYYYDWENSSPTTGVRITDGAYVVTKGNELLQSSRYSYSGRNEYTLAHMQSLKLYDLWVTYDNGKTKKITEKYDLE